MIKCVKHQINQTVAVSLYPLSLSIVHSCFNCAICVHVMQDGSCVETRSTFFSHRARHDALVQRIIVNNPSVSYTRDTRCVCFAWGMQNIFVRDAYVLHRVSTCDVPRMQMFCIPHAKHMHRVSLALVLHTELCRLNNNDKYYYKVITQTFCYFQSHCNSDKGCPYVFTKIRGVISNSFNSTALSLSDGCTLIFLLFQTLLCHLLSSILSASCEINYM